MTKKSSHPRLIASSNQTNTRKLHTNSRAGFTIIELLVATTIFSMVLVVILASFLQVGRMYYKGISLTSTSGTAHALADNIANNARLAGTYTAGGVNYFCLGNARYTYALASAGGTRVNANHISNPGSNPTAGLRLDTVSNCDPPSVGGANPQQMLGPNMQLNRFDIAYDPGNKAISLNIHIVYYGIDGGVFAPNLATDPAAQCSSGLLSTQFCATATINTNVSLRD